MTQPVHFLFDSFICLILFSFFYLQQFCYLVSSSQAPFAIHRSRGPSLHPGHPHWGPSGDRAAAIQQGRSPEAGRETKCASPDTQSNGGVGRAGRAGRWPPTLKHFQLFLMCSCCPGLAVPWVFAPYTKTPKPPIPECPRILLFNFSIWCKGHPGFCRNSPLTASTRTTCVVLYNA